MSIENRVFGNELSFVLLFYGVMGMENGKCVLLNFDNVR